MPHLKVNSFDTNTIDTLLQEDNILKFHATSLTSNDEIIGVELEDEEFLLQIKPDRVSSSN